MPTHRKRRATLSERLFLGLSEGRVVDGFWIGTSRTGADPVVTNQRVEDALAVIRAYDPSRYRRLRRDLKRIWVHLQSGGNTGSYNIALDACELDPRYVLRDNVMPSDIASVIVHEATHAKLCRYGIGSSEAMRGRLEAACRRQEHAFAARLPPSQGDKIRDKLRRMDEVPKHFWSDASSAEREETATDDALIYLGVPRYFLPVARVTRAVAGAIRRFVRTIGRGRAA